MLVDDLAAERREVDDLPALHHRICQGVGLGVAQALEVDGHAEGGHLVVGDLVPCVREHEARELGVRQLAAIALLLDQLGRAKSARCARLRAHWSTMGVPGIPRDGAFPPSQAFTVAPTSANSPSCTAPSAFRPST